MSSEHPASGRGLLPRYSSLVRLVAVLIVVAFTMLVSVDKIPCPDGRTDRTTAPLRSNPPRTTSRIRASSASATPEPATRPIRRPREESSAAKDSDPAKPLQHVESLRTTRSCYRPLVSGGTQNCKLCGRWVFDLCQS